jgi:hypothetical protein
MKAMEYVTSQAFTIGGIVYSIGVYRSAAGYMAFCDCHTCHAHNMQSSAVADKNEAIRQCEELIRQHHSDRHPSAA